MDEIVSLDSDRSFGVLTRADAAVARGLNVVLFNAGLIHRAGPFRLHVHLARQLSVLGFNVFRFDLPQVGDSPALTHGSDESLASDVMDAVQVATGSDAFIVGGICLAADFAWKIASRDTRVKGVLMMDGMAVKDHWFRVGQVGLLKQRPASKWMGMVRRAVAPKPEGTPDLVDFRDWPDHETFKTQLAEMLGRGVKVLALYTGGVPYYLLHPRQLDSTFGALRSHANLEVEYRPAFDHILFSPLDRQLAIKRISEWSRRI